MICQTCEYENPRDAKFCVECGAGLGPRARRWAERRFRSELSDTRERAEGRLQRALKPGRRHPTPSTSSSVRGE